MKPGAHIINVSSMGGFQGSTKFPGLSLYSSSKGAVSILSECLAEELNLQVSVLTAWHWAQCRRRCWKKPSQDTKQKSTPMPCPVSSKHLLRAGNYS